MHGHDTILFMPIILHGAWLRSLDTTQDHSFFLWAEDLEQSLRWDNTTSNTPTEPRPHRAASRQSNGAGRQRLPKVPSHPHQASISQLREALTTEFAAIDSSATKPMNATVWLPSQAGAPMSRRNVSRVLVTGVNNGSDRRSGNGSNGNGVQGSTVADTVGSNGTAADEVALRQWQVTGLAISPRLAMRFLTHLEQGSTATPVTGATRTFRVRIGNDLRFWSNSAKYVLEMLVGEHYLPGLRPNKNGTLAAQWMPQMSDPGIEGRRNQLIQSMPPVCRAYNTDTAQSAPSSAALLDHFVQSIAEEAIRKWASDVTLPAIDTPSISWMRSLIGASPTIALAPQPAHELYQEWRQWTERLYVVRDANFRICFVLDEPRLPDKTSDDDPIEETDGVLEFVSEASRWRLRYYLQARDNADLMVSAREAWASTRGFVMAGGRQIDQPQERLLTGLGVASRLFEPIERSLRSPQPEECHLTTEEAYHFLREVSPILESTGFGVVLPDWWYSHRDMRLALRLRLFSDSDDDVNDFADEWPEELSEQKPGLHGERPAHASQQQSSNRVNYSWELTLGGEQLTREQFDQLFAMRTPLLRLRERWVELDPDQVDAAQRFLTEPSQVGSLSLLRAVQVAQSHQSAGETEPEVGLTPDALPDDIAPESVEGVLGLEDVVLSGWIEQVLVRLRSAQPLDEILEPTGFVGQLRPYQRRGLGWLAYLRSLGLGACLADDMGLGKTIQTIALLLHVREDDGDGPHREAPALLICPTSVMANWRREMERFAPSLTVMVHHGNTRSTGAEFTKSIESTDMVVTSYGTARRDVELLVEHEWSDLILDEAQNIKTPTAKQTQAIQRLRGRNRIALTGTPVENRLMELWSIMRFLNPDYIGSRETFRRNYVVPIERYNDEERTDELRRVVQPFLLRRVKSNPDIISDLPEKNEMIVYCSMTTEQAKLYEQTVAEAMQKINDSDGIQRRGLVLALLTKLKQIANHPAQFLKQSGPLQNRSGKLARLTEMLEEALSVGDRALIFTQYVEMGRLLQRHITDTLGFDTLFLHGGSSAQQRDKMVQSFQSEDGPPVFVLSLRAGGSGLNLTRANQVFHYDRWWNPAVENQATDRAFRIGQLRNVQVHKFVAAGTLEESIHELIESKQALAQSIVGSGEEWLTELDSDQLQTLIALRYDAVGDDIV